MRAKNVTSRSLVPFLFSMLVSANACASPPFLTDDPVPTDYGHWEVYLFSSIDKNNVTDEEPDLTAPAVELDYGALPNLQLHLLVPYVWSLPSAAPAANGIGDIETGAGYRFIQETSDVPQVGIFPVVELPTGDANQNLGNGKVWMKLPIWAQKSWGSWTTDAGGGYVINHAQNMRNYPYAGWLLQKDITEKLTLGAEVFTQGAASTNSRSSTLLNAGGSYNFTKHFSVLFSAGHSVIGEEHLVGYLGLYWA